MTLKQKLLHTGDFLVNPKIHLVWCWKRLFDPHMTYIDFNDMAPFCMITRKYRNKPCNVLFHNMWCIKAWHEASAYVTDADPPAATAFVFLGSLYRLWCLCNSAKCVSSFFSFFFSIPDSQSLQNEIVWAMIFACNITVVADQNLLFADYTFWVWLWMKMFWKRSKMSIFS